MVVQPCPPRTAPGVVEYLNQQIRAAVDDRWHLIEVGAAVDHPEKLDHPTHPPEITQLGAQHRKNLQAAQLGRLPSGLNAEPPFAHLAGDQTPVRAHRPGARHEDEVISHNGRNIVSDRRHRRRQFDAQFLQPLIGVHVASLPQPPPRTANTSPARPMRWD
jgi:hypothetical protein